MRKLLHELKFKEKSHNYYILHDHQSILYEIGT